MASEARQTILAKVRQAQKRAVIPETSEGMPERYAYPKLDAAALRERLRVEFELLGVECFEESSEEGVRARVKLIVSGKSVLAWDGEQLPYGLDACLKNETVYRGSDAKAEQGKAEIGLSGCAAALAETGTLAITSAAGKPRTASLLPYIHVAVIRSRDILLGMGEFFDTFPKGERLPYLVFVTGPSRTADIELSLTLGVHGPGKLIAVIGP